MKRIWKVAPQNTHLSQSLAKALDTSPLFAQVLINRGFSDEGKARLFLRAKLNQLHSPWLFKDMNWAVSLIEKAIKNKDPILIYGDYDVDGITGTAILFKALKVLGGQVSFYIPHRLKEGYGLNKRALKEAIDSGVKLVITCDCGTNDLEALNFAGGLNCNIVITDHHRLNIARSSKFPLINPAISTSPYPYKYLAGVGVAFKLAQALLERFDLKDKERWEIEHLDLVALGTIADSVPVTGENRVFIKHGLKRLNRSLNFGIQALKEVSGLKSKELDCKKVGFVLAPRINAAGRLENGSLGVKLLSTDSFEEAMSLAKMMDTLNRKRQDIQEVIFKLSVFNKLFYELHRLFLWKDTGDEEERSLHDCVDPHTETEILGDLHRIDYIESDILVDDLLLHLLRYLVPDLVRPVG